MASKFLIDRSKLQNDLLKELIAIEIPNPSDAKKLLAAAVKKLPNSSFLTVNSNVVERKIDGLCKKFNVSSQKELAAEFRRKSSEYLAFGREEDSQGREEIDIEYSVMHFLLAISRNPVNIKYECELEEDELSIEEEIDWHKILVADFQYSDNSEEEWSSSGVELESEEEELEYIPPAAVPVKKNEMVAADIPNYSDICDALVKQYWRNYTNHEHLTELQVIREIINMLQGAPNSFVFECHDHEEVCLRDDITIKHYSHSALHSTLRDFKDKISMVQSLHTLCDDVLNCVAQPSHPYGSRTFQAFTCAIVMYLYQLTEALGHIEIKVKEQDDIVTLTGLREAVTDHFEIVTVLYEMVQEILNRTELGSPSVCVTQLINTIFETLELYESMGILTEHITKVLLTILLCTLQPLLSTIDLWLAHGDLNNSTGELFLCRDPNIPCSSREYWDAGLTFKLRERAMSDQVPGVLMSLSQKMLKAGKAVELIKNLGKLGVPDANIFAVLIKNYLGTSLCFDAEVQRWSTGALAEVKTAARNVAVDPLMLSAFSDMMADVSSKKREERLPIYTDIWESIEKLHIIPSTALMKVLIPLMENRCTQVSFSLLTTLRKNFSLDGHLATLRKALLMEAGLPMSTFCEEMFRDVYDGEKIRIMTSFLKECLNTHTEFCGYLRMEVRNISNLDSRICSEIDIFQTVQLTYSPPFPIDVVLDPKLMEIYQRVFQLLLQINYAAWCVQPLSLVSYHNDAAVSTYVHCFRHELNHFIKMIQAYTMQRVLHCTGSEMRHELDTALELDDYAQIHKKYCLQMEEFCLLTPEFKTMLGAIRHVLNEAVKFKRLWDRKDLDESPLDKVMSEVNKCIRFVTMLVQRRNQMSVVPQPHFDWLETCLRR